VVVVMVVWEEVERIPVPSTSSPINKQSQGSQ